MDLLATVRKEGSRGGRGDFQWSDVQTSSHRENYLGHSLMAPVGRWQKGRDLNWFAKADKDADTGEDADAKAARERREEIRRIKEAEEDALARALGLPVAPRNNPNLEMIGAQREVGKVLKEAAEDDGLAGTGGVGYGRATGVSGAKEGEVTTERLAGTGGEQDKELQNALKEYRRRHGERRQRSRSRERHTDGRHRRRHRDEAPRPRDRRQRSPRDRHKGRRSRSVSSERDRSHQRRERPRSRSPGRHRRHEEHRRHENARRDNRR